MIPGEDGCHRCGDPATKRLKVVMPQQIAVTLWCDRHIGRVETDHWLDYINGGSLYRVESIS